jgi:hypothetical protein
VGSDRHRASPRRPPAARAESAVASYSKTRVALPRKHHAKWLFPQEKPPRTLLARARSFWFFSNGAGSCLRLRRAAMQLRGAHAIVFSALV